MTNLIERLERKLEIRAKWKGTVHEWKKVKNTEVGNGLIRDIITALREKDARIAELEGLLVGSRDHQAKAGDV